MADRYVVGGGDVVDRFRPDLKLLVLLALAAVLFLLGTRHGIGILPDSTRYMQLVSTPYDAPLYAWLLKAGSLLGLDVTEVALGLSFVLYGLNTVLVYRLLDRATSGQPALVIVGTLLIIVHPTFLGLNTVAMSEPLFFALMLFAVNFFVAYMERQDRRLLAASSVSVGLAMLARFVAAPLGASFAAIILLCSSRRDIGRRCFDVALLFIISAGVFLCWAVASKILVGRAVGRAFWFYGNPDADLWIGGLSVLSSLFLPSQVSNLVRIPIVLAVILVALIIVARTAGRAWLASKVSIWDLYVLIFGFFAVFYALFVVLSVFIEANLQLNSRYLLLIYTSLVFVFIISSARFLDAAAVRPMLSRLIIVSFLALLAANMLRSAVQTKGAYEEGVGYQSLAWQSSPLVAAVRALPDNATIFSNACDPLNYLTRRWTFWIPSHSERRTGLESEEASFAEQIQSFRQALAQPDAYVVFADAIDWRFYFPSEEELVRLAQLKLVRSEADGRIYQAQSKDD